MSEADSKRLRYLLHEVGITLDEPTPGRAPQEATEERIDRDEIRRILIERGAPDDASTDWLVDSCPSMAAARAFTPPRRI